MTFWSATGIHLKSYILFYSLHSSHAHDDAPADDAAAANDDDDDNDDDVKITRLQK